MKCMHVVVISIRVISDHTLLSKNLRIMLACCRDLYGAHYAQNYAGVIFASLTVVLRMSLMYPTSHLVII